MFVDKAGAYLRGQHMKRCSTWVSSSLTHKHLNRLENLASDKHSSLLRKLVNYGKKTFYNIGPKMESVTGEKRSSLLRKFQAFVTLTSVAIISSLVVGVVNVVFVVVVSYLVSIL